MAEAEQEPVKFLDKAGDSYLSTHAATPFILEGKRWPSAEHFYCAQLVDDGPIREQIRRLAKPDEAAGLAKAHPAQKLIEDVKHEALFNALLAKYRQHPCLGSRLLDTGTRPLVATDRPEPIASPPGMPPVLVGNVLADIRDVLRTTEGNHPYLECRLGGLFNILDAAYVSSQPFTSETKGGERELFVNHFLRVALPPAYRFSSGEIVDVNRRRSGQVDVLIEPPLLYSFPIVEDGPRMHLAEGVSVAIEVKSNLAEAWGGVRSTASKIKSLERRFQDQLDEQLLEMQVIHAQFSGAEQAVKDQLDKEMKEFRKRILGHAGPKVPVLAVGFEGWNDAEKLKTAMEKSPDVDAVFVIGERQFWRRRLEHPGQYIWYEGIWSLMACLDFLMDHVRKTSMIYPTTSNYFYGPKLG